MCEPQFSVTPKSKGVERPRGVGLDQAFCLTQPVTCGNVCPLWRLPPREED